ncbi:MAG: tetratricopeptide repeat protein [Imperialibacter sp.]|uniref:tetratricopeptide repeat-containing sensor histidine kinase n=1 Tax=Imperialibacter sp. TaxID=2038411 RepID=UPI003A8455D9
MKLKHFVLVVILGFCCQTHGQGLEKSTEIDSLFAIVDGLSMTSPDSSLSAAIPLEPLLIELGDKQKLGLFYRNMSLAYSKKTDYLNTIKFGQKSIELYRELGDSLRVAYNYNTLANTYQYLGNRRKALELLFRSLELRKAFGSPEQYTIGLHSLGNYLMEIGEYEKAEHYFLDAKKVLLELDDISRLSDLYASLGVLYGLLKDYDRSSEFYEAALQMFEELGETSQFSVIWYSLGYNFFKQGDFQKAKAYFLRVHDSDLRIRDKYKYCYNLLLLARVVNQLEDHQAALSYVKMGDELANEIGALAYRKEAQNLYSIIYSETGEFDKAYNSLELYHDLSDSLYGFEKENTIKELTIKYETELKEKEIAKLTSEKKAQEQEVLLATSEKNAYRVGIVLAVALAIAVSAFFAQRQKASQLRSMQALTERNVRIDALLKEQEVSSLNALIEGQEKERMRIAEELHDRLGSMLSAIKLNFIGSTVKKDVEQKSPENETVKITQMLDEAVTEVRRISHNLSTGQVSRYGLVSSMDDLAARINQSDSVAMKVMHFNLEERLPVEMETGIYRITQEMLANVLKHAHASEFIVQLNKTENSVILTAEDDGIGFDYKEA